MPISQTIADWRFHRSGLPGTGRLPQSPRCLPSAGQVLFESIRGFYYAETAAILIVVVLTVTIIDLLSQQLRKLVI